MFNITNSITNKNKYVILCYFYTFVAFKKIIFVSYIKNCLDEN